METGEKVRFSRKDLVKPQVGASSVSGSTPLGSTRECHLTCGNAVSEGIFRAYRWAHRCLPGVGEPSDPNGLLDSVSPGDPLGLGGEAVGAGRLCGSLWRYRCVGVHPAVGW